MRIAFITPFPPYRGGISKHSENIYNQIKIKHHIEIFNFKRQYPNILFPGKTQYISNFKFDLYKSNQIIDSINPITWYKTANAIIDGEFDKVIFRFWHPFFCPAYITICRRLKKLNKNIKLYAICDNIIPHETFFYQRNLIKRFLNYIDKNIVMSDQVEKELISINDNYNYVKLFLPILDDLGPKLSKNNACKSINIDSAKINFLFFGLIRDYKGLDILLKAINNLDPVINSNINLIIAGEFYDKVYKYNNICKNTNVYLFNRYIPDDEVNMYFSASDYVILPYKTASQSGIIPMAYHFNLPVIISDLTSLLHNIIINKTGFVFKNKDYKDLSDLITNIVLGNKSNDFSYIKEYRKKYTTKVFVDKLVSSIK